MTNRVDELESQVDKLQATVNGLTEELVEAKERIRLLEESVDVDLTSGTRSVGHDPDVSAEGRDNTEADPAPAGDSEDTNPASGGSDPLAESQAQATSRSRASGTPSDDANFIDAGSGDGGSAGGEPEATETPTTTPDGDGTKSDEDDGEVTVEDDDIIVA
jgi:hypothetical protein